MNEISLPYHLIIPSLISILILGIIFLKRKKLFASGKWKWFWISTVVFFGIYLLAVGGATYSDLNAQLTLNEFDLNKDGFFSGEEITSEQKKETQYFFINKKDSLISKLRNFENGKISGYKIINEEKVIKKHRRLSGIKDNDVEYETFDEIYFSFNKINDTIISKSFFDKLKVINTRREFLDINKHFNETVNEFIFIEPINCMKFILRNVKPIIPE